MKSISKSLFLLLALTLLLCSSACESVPSTENSLEETFSEEITTENVVITWIDYVPSASTNVNRVGYCDLEKGTPYDTKSLVNTPSENTIGFCAHVMCPHCKREETVYFDFDQLPQEKLGEKVIVLEKQIQCWSWDKHADSFTDKYPVSVLLTLNK